MRPLLAAVFAFACIVPAQAHSTLDRLAGALLGFGRAPTVHETETCAAELNYLAALDADPNTIAIPLPDHGVVTVTRKDVEAMLLAMQFAYLANPQGSDREIDRIIDQSHLGILEGAAMSTLAKSALTGDPAAKEAAITMMMTEAKAKVRKIRGDVQAKTGDAADPCTGLVPPPMPERP